VQRIFKVNWTNIHFKNPFSDHALLTPHASYTYTYTHNTLECERPEYQTCHKEFGYCVDTDGSFECHCLIGLRGNGTHCFDDSAFCEDDSLNDCHRDAECSIDNVEAPGSFLCTCKRGYQGSGIACEDVDECISESTCLQGAACNNTVGCMCMCMCKCKCIESLKMGRKMDIWRPKKIAETYREK